ncbi:MAG: AarF/ABC1/UbiB kinase family protein [Candidatus Nanoarchaeia archaeon]|nr:AarF/ABC1/UbiB kinase family protein [Candidatus Nanoarchaeia archaeon]
MEEASTNVNHEISSVKRLRQITNALFKQGMGYAIDRLELKRHLTFHKRLQKEEFSKPITSLPVRLRRVLETLGGTFIKLGQMLSMRYDLLPKEYCDEFAKLQDDVKPMHFRIVKQIIEEDLKQSLSRVFKEFDTKPIASASIGQVHKAKLRTGEMVAVKVQRPRLYDLFTADTKLFHYLAKLIEHRYPEVKEYDLNTIINEFESYSKKELDYMLEARNIEIFHNNFKNDANVSVPKVYWEHTTRRVITMSYVHGVKISDVADFETYHSSMKAMSNNVFNAMLDQIFDFRVFHADPHPGNILLLGHNKIAFLDFGIVGRVTPDMVDGMEEILIGLLTMDLDIIVSAFQRLGISDPAAFNSKQFKEDLVDHFAEYYDASNNQINFATFFTNAFDMARKYKMKLPINFILLGKSIITLQGFGARYIPDFNFTEYMKPRIEQMIKERISPGHVYTNMRKAAINTRDFLSNLPSDLNSFFKTWKDGQKLKLEVRKSDMDRAVVELDRSSNRLVIGFIIGAIIVSNALIIHARVPPLWFGIPALTYFGVFLIIWLGVLLTISILREGKYRSED